MTEAEWAECRDPQPMLEFLRGTVSQRKLLLITIACLRHAWWYCLTSRRSIEALKRAERCADDRSVSEKELQRVNAKMADIAAARSGYFTLDEGRALVTRDLRDIIGNPFRPVPIDLAWLSWNDGTETNLAA